MAFGDADASTPSFAVAGSGATVTTASFTPPAGALLVAYAFHDTASGNTTNTSVITDSLGLTWTIRATRSKGNDGAAQNGHVQVSTATATGAAMTVTTTGTNTLGACALGVRVVTAADTGNPIGALGEGSNAGAAISFNITTAVNGERCFMIASDWNVTAGNMTAGTNQTAVRSQGIGSGPDLRVYVGVQNAVTTTAGTVVTMSTAAPTSGNTNNYIGFGIRPSSGTAYTKSADDPLGLTDGATTTVDATRTVTDAAGLTDAVSRTVTADRTVTDPVGLTDAVSVAAGRTVTDGLGATDAATASVDAARTVTDPVGLTDAASATADAERVLADSVALTDTASTTADTTRTVTDAVGITDSVTVTRTIERVVADPLGLVDDTSVDGAAGYTRMVADPLAITDTATSTVDAARAATDPLSLTDTVAALASTGRVLVDPVGLVDSVVVSLTVERFIADALGLDDDTSHTGGGEPIENIPATYANASGTRPTLTAGGMRPNLTAATTPPR